MHPLVSCVALNVLDDEDLDAMALNFCEWSKFKGYGHLCTKGKRLSKKAPFPRYPKGKASLMYLKEKASPMYLRKQVLLLSLHNPHHSFYHPFLPNHHFDLFHHRHCYPLLPHHLFYPHQRHLLHKD